MPVWFYDWSAAVPYSKEEHGQLHEQLLLAIRAEGLTPPSRGRPAASRKSAPHVER